MLAVLDTAVAADPMIILVLRLTAVDMLVVLLQVQVVDQPVVVAEGAAPELVPMVPDQRAATVELVQYLQ